MRNILAVPFAVMFLSAPLVQAFTVPEEVQVVPPSTTVGANSSAQNFVPPSPALDKKEINDLLANSRKKIEATINKKNTEAAEAFKILAGQVDDQKKSVDTLVGKMGEIEKIPTNVNTQLEDFNKKFFDEKDGVVKNLIDNIWSAGKELGKDLDRINSWVVFGIFLSIIIIALLVLGFLWLRKSLQSGFSGTNGVREEVQNIGTGIQALSDKIDDLPEETAARVKALDPMVIEFDDVMGHQVTYHAPIIDGTYVTPYVPSTVTKSVSDPTQIVRVRTADKGAVRRSTRKVVASYLTATAKNAPAPATEQEKQQIALIDHLKTTGELVIK